MSSFSEMYNFFTILGQATGVNPDNIWFLFEEFKDGHKRSMPYHGSPRPKNHPVPPEGFASFEAYNSWTKLNRPQIPVKTGRGGKVCTADISRICILNQIKESISHNEFISWRVQRCANANGITPIQIPNHVRTGPVRPDGVKLITNQDIENYLNHARSMGMVSQAAAQIATVREAKRNAGEISSRPSKRRRLKKDEEDMEGFA